MTIPQDCQSVSKSDSACLQTAALIESGLLIESIFDFIRLLADVFVDFTIFSVLITVQHGDS